MKAVPRPAALQLYSVREDAARDLASTLARARGIGYGAVETGAPFGMEVKRLRLLLDDLAIRVPSTHGALPDTDEARSALEEHAVLGSPLVFVSSTSGDFTSLDAVRAYADRFVAGREAAHRAGLELGYHNHWWEFSSRLGDKSAYEVFLEALEERSPGVALEIDVYWAAVGGEDPTALVGRLGGRVGRLHVKDGPGGVEAPMTAVGSGVVDVPSVLQVNPHVLWHIVELDRCATDMWGAVTDSLAYLVDHGLSTAAG